MVRDGAVAVGSMGYDGLVMALVAEWPRRPTAAPGNRHPDPLTSPG
ncbi:hypothetical protein AB0D66_12505 [Streptomyces sp. NPDC048270]